MPSSAYAAVTRGNARRQAQARAAGRATFSRERIEGHLGCVTCGQEIAPAGLAAGRMCDCPGSWRLDWTTGEWAQKEADRG